MRSLLLLLFFPFSLIGQKHTDTNSIVARANGFINSLNEDQKLKALYVFSEMNRYEWHYVPPTQKPRTGIAIKDLDSDQKKLAYILLHAFLSKEGYAKTKSIMSLEDVLHELEPNNKSRISENYFIAFYGLPEKDSVWGWKFGGHHIALNFTVIKNKIAFAPFFFGANPAAVPSGAQRGMRVMKAEEDIGFELLNSLTLSEKQKAIFRLEAFSEIVTANSPNLTPLTPTGIFAKDFTLEQKKILNKLIAAYLSSMPPKLAKIRMDRIKIKDLDSLYFGWAGETIPGKPHYYRIQGKSFLIEFDNTQNNANHIHTVWRDFNGDYGLDLLREHYRNSKHHQH